ncbi:MAG: hypothetical protein JNL53_13545, partial [Cyclobacteriaceae bacterium]|nr:hypothetical protein [Cyclobacteriaceae bacterium]
RMRLRNRVMTSYGQLNSLLDSMAQDELSKQENVSQLKNELAELYQDGEFLKNETMGQIVRTSLQMLEKYPVRNRLRSKPVLV